MKRSYPRNQNPHQGRLLVPRPETLDGDLTKRNVITTDQDHELANAALVACLARERTKTREQRAADLAALVALDAAIPPFAFEQIAAGEASQ